MNATRDKAGRQRPFEDPQPGTWRDQGRVPSTLKMPLNWTDGPGDASQPNPVIQVRLYDEAGSI